MMKRFNLYRSIAWILMVGVIAGCGCAKDDNLDQETVSDADISQETQEETVLDIIERPTDLFYTRKEEKYDITPEGGTEITSNFMTYDEAAYKSDKTKEYYNYTEGDMSISLRCRGGNPEELVVNGTSFKHSILPDSGMPEVWIRDLNKDGKNDAIIEWQGWRTDNLIVVVSSGNTYKKVTLEETMPDISAVALDDYKMQVVSKACNVDAEYELQNRYAEVLLSSYMVYYETGKLAKASYNIPIGGARQINSACYTVGEDTVIAVKKQVETDDKSGYSGYFTGITLVYYYKYGADGSLTTEIKMVNENCYPF